MYPAHLPKTTAETKKNKQAYSRDSCSAICQVARAKFIPRSATATNFLPGHSSEAMEERGSSRTKDCDRPLPPVVRQLEVRPGFIVDVYDPKLTERQRRWNFSSGATSKNIREALQSAQGEGKELTTGEVRQASLPPSPAPFRKQYGSGRNAGGNPTGHWFCLG